MNAFISYSHQDDVMLNLLHKHLAQLERDNVITAWTDKAILAGGKVDSTISEKLESAGLFIALLSPDYIASNYCYNKEFQKALKMEKEGKLIIVPIILEPCDWLNTPMKDFKAIPKDGKPVSTWENKNTAFLDVIQNIRSLLSSSTSVKPVTGNRTAGLSRNYKVKKDFDSIEKIEFREKTFNEVKKFLLRFIEEIQIIENIKTRILIDGSNEFEAILVNRNKIATESHLKFSIKEDNSSGFMFSNSEKQLVYSIGNPSRPNNNSFILSMDDYQMYWSDNSFYRSSQNKNEFGPKEIADKIWNEWLESVGIS